MRADAERLMRAIGSEFSDPPEPLDPIWRDAPARKVLDCVVRYVESVLGRWVTPAEALYLLEEAATGGGFDLRRVDVAIWEKAVRSGSRG
jgi:hypothetical protein